MRDSLMRDFVLKPSTGEERDRTARRPDQGAAAGGRSGQQPRGAPQVAG